MTDTAWELPGGSDQEHPAAPESISLPEAAVSAHLETILATQQASQDSTAGELLRLIGAGFIALGGLALAGYLFPHAGHEAVSELWDIDALFIPQALGFLIAAGLLLFRRTRALASGLVLGAVPLWFAEQINALRPSSMFAADDRASGICLLVGGGAFVAGFLLVLAATLKGRPDKRARARSAARKSTREARSARLITMLTGIAGLAAFVAGRFMDWEATTVRLTNQNDIPPVREACCAIGTADPWIRADYIASALVLLGVIAAAAIVRPRARGAGVLFGAVALLVTGLSQALVAMLAPLRSNGDLAEIAATSHLSVTVEPLAGFWVAVIGLVLLAGAAVLLLVLNPDRVRYPEAAPGAVIAA